MVPVALQSRKAGAENVVARASKQKDTTKANEEIDRSEWQCLNWATCGNYVSERSTIHLYWPERTKAAEEGRSGGPEAAPGGVEGMRRRVGYQGQPHGYKLYP